MSEKAPSTYAIEQTYTAWQRWRDSIRREIPDIDDETLDQMTGKETDDIAQMEMQVLDWVRMNEGFAVTCKAQRDILMGREKRFEKAGRWGRAILLAMTSKKTTVLPTGTLTVKYTKPSGRLTDITRVPEKYIVTKTVREVIPEFFADLEAGEVIPGGELTNSMPYISIK